jgi:hypothetical protein
MQRQPWQASRLIGALARMHRVMPDMLVETLAPGHDARVFDPEGPEIRVKYVVFVCTHNPGLRSDGEIRACADAILSEYDEVPVRSFVP